MKTSILLLLASLLSVSVVGSDDDSEDEDIIDLYSKDGPVVHIDQSNFDSLIHGKPFFWLVEFYSSWCGHCQLYATAWLGIARQSASKCWREPGMAMRNLRSLLTHCLSLFII